MKNSLLDKIGTYLVELQKSADSTKHANDRSAYTKHLAEGARWVSLIYSGKSEADVKKEILDYQRAYGWGFLSGNEGNAAESAFTKLISSIQ